VWLYCLLSGSHLIIDSHTDALLAPWWRWTLPLHRFLSRRAICTIVTNDYLREMVEAWGAPAFVLADVPTEFHYREYPVQEPFAVAMVSSFSYDEPRQRVFQVAQRLPDVHFYITGDLKLARSTELEQPPPNVHFTGFLQTEDYYGLLASAQAVMVLTTENHTLQWGACEAISLGKPVITSDWPFLKEYFHKGTVHVDNSIEGIYQGVVQLRQEWERYDQEAKELRQERQLEWAQKQAELMRMIHQATDTA
jgi:glycosyltransferase involved in cell wall biosynthesis